MLTKDGAALPVLFIGSGFSRRYLNSPTWEGLLERFATKLGRPMSYYRAKAAGDMPKVASLMASDLFEPWFKAIEYQESREAFEDQIEIESDPLKYEITKYLETLELPNSGPEKAEIEAFADVHVQAVLTTNWDTILEDALPDFETFVGQNDVLFTTLQSVGEIYKIHGSVTNPHSLVLTDEDYQTYWERNPYLIAKMLTLFVEHPVIFIGYSVSDPHIRQLLSNLVECLTPAQLTVLNDRLIFVDWRPAGEPTEFSNGSLTVSSHTIAIKQYAAADYTELYEMLASLPRRFSAKFMRQMKDSVYKLAYDSIPTGRVRVLDLKDGDDIENLQVVVGVGTFERLAEVGYGHFSREDLIRDMLFGASQHDPEGLMSRAIPELFSIVKYLPIYYPLRLAGRIDNANQVDETDLPHRARELLANPACIHTYETSKNALRRTQSFREILDEDEQIAINHGVWCEYEADDVVQLREFLVTLLTRSRKINTAVAKLACKYDQLVFGFGYSGNRAELLERLDVEPTL